MNLHEAIEIPENGIIKESILKKIQSENAIGVFAGESNGQRYEWTIFGSDITEPRGIVAEARTAVIKYLFEEVGMNRVAARHDPNNPNSGRVMHKCGMKYEGAARASDRNNQGICDADYYAILRDNWGKPKHFMET